MLDTHKSIASKRLAVLNSKADFVLELLLMRLLLLLLR
jgi:hypothetical protein